MAHSCSLNLAFEYDCPLEFAIRRRSLKDLASEIRNHRVRRCHTFTTYEETVFATRTEIRFCHETMEMLSSTLDWPEGLRMLISSGLLQLTPENQTAVAGCVHALVDYHKLDSLKILSVAGFPVHPGAWLRACEHHADQKTAWLRESYLETIQCLAELMYECVSIPLTRWISGQWKPSAVLTLDSLFCSGSLRLETARCLLNAGFVFKDKPPLISPEDCYIRHGTPLWIQSIEFFRSERGETLLWLTMSWMVDQESNLNWVHPELGITPAHTIASRYACGSRYKSFVRTTSAQSEVQSLMSKVLLSHTDSCSCYCSVSGCSVFGCIARQFRGLKLLQLANKAWYWGFLEAIFNAVDSSPQKPSFGLSILRVMTFDELGLTHTCCHLIVENVRPYDYNFRTLAAQEIQDLYHIESKAISILEKLMTELEPQWSRHSGSFKSFLKRIWVPRMRKHHHQVLIDQQKDGARGLMELGVVLKETGEPKAECRTNDLGDDALDASTSRAESDSEELSDEDDGPDVWNTKSTR